MVHKNIFKRPVIFTVLVLLIPLVAMQFTEEVNWDLADFVIGGVLLFVVGVGYELLFKKIKKPSRRLALAIVLGLLFIYVWAELAVGIFNIPGISGS